MAGNLHRAIPRPTLGQFVALGFTALALLLGALLVVFHAGSRRTLLVASAQLMQQASRRVSERVDEHLGEAERVVAGLEAQARLGLLATDALEPLLLGALEGAPGVTDVTFTYGRADGVYAEDQAPHDAGDLRVVASSAGQVEVTRSAGSEDRPVLVRRLRPGPDGWRADAAFVAPDGTRTPLAAASGPVAADPTTHATFTTPSRAEFRDRALWSDLAFFEADAALPEMQRRRVVSVQKALWAPRGTFLGVVRVALASERLDALVRIAVDDTVAPDDHVVFLCDGVGRLITRLGPADRFALLDAAGRDDPEGDVRVVPAMLPPAIAAALAAPATRDAANDDAMVHRLDVDGVAWLASTAAVLGERTQGWRVGIVVPEAHYLGALAASLRRTLVLAALLTLAAALAIGAGLRAMRRDLDRLIGETTRLQSFDFRPATRHPATFRDVRAAARSVEQAKTALRALGKYAPLDLVRDLYEAHREPTLGAEPCDVTLLFSDVAGFTSVAETLDPDVLATALGAYLEALTTAVHAHGGIIDKYTGDGVMALWNTPRALADHPTHACAAALACAAAADALFASPAWQGRTPWRTRFGIHRATVTVGHFGAPERMSFTAMGDGVNLASRLEGLGKQYGVAIVVSAAVVDAARERFWFRRLDRVAVQGKRMGVEVYELVGTRRDAHEPPPAVVAPYEAALAAYYAGDFAGALAGFTALADDPPSRVLADRCRGFLAVPPASGWDGVWIAATK